MASTAGRVTATVLEPLPTLDAPLTIARTKLVPPVLRKDVILRERLLTTLGERLFEVPLTLVSAPAGYGKTTLLASLPRVFAEARLAWLALDEADDCATQLFTGLLLAVERVVPACGRRAKEALGHGDGSGRTLRHALDLLVNDLPEAASAPLVVVLDDLHRVAEAAVYEGLDHLVERLPPHVHLVLAGRHEPPLALARWRARRQLAELRLDDLRFTPEETTRFLNGALGLELSPEHLATLLRRSEGWAAGLSLLAGAYARSPSGHGPELVFAQPMLTDRHVFEFLAAEVLATLPEDERRFVQAIAVLDELTPELCAAVSGRADARALLETLYRRNLFVVALDEAAGSFRFHDIFRDFLLRTLARDEPDGLRDLHRRAAAAEPHTARAIAHCAAAGMWREAARCIEEHAVELLRRGAAETLRGLIAALPAAALDEQPRLRLYLGIAAWCRWELDDALAALERARQGFLARGDDAGRGEALACLGHVLNTRADFAGTAAVLDEAWRCPLRPATRAQVLVQRAWLAMSLGEPAKVLEALDALLDHVETSADDEILHVLSDKVHCHFLGIPGAVDRLERFCRLAEPLLDDSAGPLATSWWRNQAWIRQWRGRFAAATEAAERALELSARLGGIPWVLLDVHTFLGVKTGFAGDDEAARRSFGVVFEELARPGVRTFWQVWGAAYVLAEARVWMLRGDVAGLAAAAARLDDARRDPEWPIAPMARDLIDCFLKMSAGAWDDAEACLGRVARLQERVRLFSFAPDARVLLAHAARQGGDAAAALERLAPALAEHEAGDTPGGLLWSGREVIGPLLRLAAQEGVHGGFAARCLGLLDEAPAAAGDGMLVAATGERLSAREVEVLGLLAEGASNADIGTRLFISVHTVKRHVANLLAKLAASSRGEAAAAARRLGLL